MAGWHSIFVGSMALIRFIRLAGVFAWVIEASSIANYESGHGPKVKTHSIRLSSGASFFISQDPPIGGMFIAQALGDFPTQKVNRSDRLSSGLYLPSRSLSVTHKLNSSC